MNRIWLGTKRDMYNKQLSLNLLKKIPDELKADNGKQDILTLISCIYYAYFKLVI